MFGHDRRSPATHAHFCNGIMVAGLAPTAIGSGRNDIHGSSRLVGYQRDIPPNELLARSLGG